MSSPYTYNATLLRVVDGDTIEVDIDLGFYMTVRTAVRLAHINAPEHNTIEGMQATDHLRLLLALMFSMPKALRLLTIKPHDKYGRYLAEVYTNTNDNAISINEQMVVDGFAVPYEGGAR